MASAMPRAPLSWLLIPLIVGYLSGDTLPHLPKLFILSGFALSLLALIPAFSNNKKIHSCWPIPVFLAMALLAAGHLQFRLQPLPEWNSLPPREAILTLSVDRLYSSPPNGKKAQGIATIRKTDPHLRELTGHKIHFSIWTDPDDQIKTSSLLTTSGILEALPEHPANPFEQHLLRNGVRFYYRTGVLKDEVKEGSGIAAFCSRQNDRLEQFLRTGSNENQNIADIFVAMLLGKRSTLSTEQERIFQLTGALHLFAISGLHIGVIAFALHNLLTLLRLPPKISTIAGLLLLLLFVGITGASPSAMRAFLMIAFFWSARFFRRNSNPVAALANSALLVLLIYPGQLWSPGFQLSYVVVTGILLLGLPLAKHLNTKWTPFKGIPPDLLTPFQRLSAGFLREFISTFSISMAATLLSSPLTIHYFGVFAPGAVLLNLILIPLASLVLIAGFISILLNLLLLAPLAAVYNHAAWIILFIMEYAARAAISLPLFWNAGFATPWTGPTLLLLLLVTLFICASRQWKAPFFHFVIPFLLFTLLLTMAAQLTFPTD